MPATFPNPVYRTLQDIVLQDFKENQDPNGQYIGNMIDVLRTQNRFLDDMVYRPANFGLDKYKHKIVTSYPKTYWARYGRGIPPSKDSFAMVEETCGKLKSACQVEKEMADDLGGAGGRNQLILETETLHMKALARDMTRYMFYGDRLTTPEAFDGLSVRYNTLSKDEPTAKNVIDCGGTGPNLTSIWLVAWGQGCHGIYPKFGNVGIQTSRRICDLPDPEGYPIPHYHTEFKWQLGLAIPDWRKVVRLCNIDVDALRTGTGIGEADMSKPGNMSLLVRLIQAVGLLNGAREPGDRVAFYMNEDAMNGLRVLATRENAKVVRFETTANVFGEPDYMSVFGTPCHQVDVLSSQEQRIAA